MRRSASCSQQEAPEQKSGCLYSDPSGKYDASSSPPHPHCRQLTSASCSSDEEDDDDGLHQQAGNLRVRKTTVMMKMEVGCWDRRQRSGVGGSTGLVGGTNWFQLEGQTPMVWGRGITGRGLMGRGLSWAWPVVGVACGQ